MRISVLGAVVAALLALMAACGGSDPPTSTDTGVPGVATLSGLQAQLASVVLQQADVPQGLEGAAPAFSTNTDVAGPDDAMLQTLLAEGRQLGADVSFIPTDALDPNSPLRGGIQSSASVYLTSEGATTSFDQTATQALANNWQANYPDIRNLQVTEVKHPIGDESLWLRLAGVGQCDSPDTTTPGPSGPAATNICQQHTLIVDNVIFRAGRVREYIQVSTLFPLGSSPDEFEDQVLQWAQAALQHAKATFP